MSNWTGPVLRMAKWIDAHLEKEATLTDMAREIGYSPAYCSMQFHRMTGLTLREYAMQRRLYRAALAIRETEARLIDIALDCGYATHEALSVAFRRAYGVTPAEDRRSGCLIPLPLPFCSQKKGGEHMLTETTFAWSTYLRTGTWAYSVRPCRWMSASGRVTTATWLPTRWSP